MTGSAALVFDPWAPQRQARASARVGALEQLVQGWQVEAVQAPLVPPAVVVERDAPNEVSPVREARLRAALGQGQEVWPFHGSGVGVLGTARSPSRQLGGPPPTRGQR